MAPGETRKIRLSVKFNPLEPPPQILGFRLNARVVCPENGLLDKNAPVAVVPVTAPVALVSPCPAVFSYEPLNETDKWYGVVTLPDSQLNGVRLSIKLDTVSVQLGVSEQVAMTSVVFRLSAFGGGSFLSSLLNMILQPLGEVNAVFG